MVITTGWLGWCSFLLLCLPRLLWILVLLAYGWVIAEEFSSGVCDDDWCFYFGFFPIKYPSSLLFQSMCLSDHCSLRRLRGHTCCHYRCHISARKCQLQSRCCDLGCCGRALDNVIPVTEWDVEAGDVYFETHWAWSRTHGSGDHVAKFLQMVKLWNLPLIPQWNISVIGIKCWWVSAVLAAGLKTWWSFLWKNILAWHIPLSAGLVTKLLQWNKSVECVLPLLRSFCTC